MSVSHRYRNFGGKKSSADKNDAAGSNAKEDLEDQKLQAFEAGYQAGWDDSIKAQATEMDKVSSELGQNLLDMSFTYHEALSKLTNSIEPVMRQIVEKLLPELADASLSAHIVEQIHSAIQQCADTSIEIVVSADKVKTVQGLIEEKIVEPFQIVGDADLADGQAFLRIGDTEREINLDTLISEVSKAMRAFFHESGVGEKNG